MQLSGGGFEPAQSPVHGDPRLAQDRRHEPQDLLAEPVQRRLARRAPGSSGYFVTRIGGKSTKPIFDRNGGHSRKLASNEKLFTTATALHRLGPKWRIPTRVKISGRVRKGRLRGDIYLIGGGDPSFGADGVHDLARQVRREGIRRIGEVVTEQVQLYGTLTGELEAVKLPEEPAPSPQVEEPLPRGADILQMPDRAERARRAGY